MLIAALNPCPCGYRGDKTKECVCSPSLLQKYQRKISGPIIDRIDLWVTVGNVDYKKLSDEVIRSEKTHTIKARVKAARLIQEKRFRASKRGIKTNSDF